jgi:hypothetical protein
MNNATIPAAPALPASAPTVYEMWDWSGAAPVMTSAITLDTRGPDYISEDEVYAAERGAAAWYRSNKVLTIGEFTAGAHLFVSHAANTKSGTRPLEEVLIAFAKPSWKGYPSAEFYNKKTESVFMPAFKIVAKDAAGNVVHSFQMRDGLPINDKSLHQGFPTTEKPHRPKLSCFNFLPWQNERARRSASLSHMFPGIIDEAMRPSTAKSHYSVLSCEPSITGGYNGNSLNSLGGMWQAPQWPMPDGVHWGAYEQKDPYCNYVDSAYYGKSAHLGPYVMGWDYEPGSRTGHNWYTAPGGPRFDRCTIASQIAAWATDPNWKRIDGGIPGEDIAYGYSMAHANHHNKQVSNPAALFWCADADVLLSKKYYIGNYYGDGGRRGPDAIEVNANQRDGTGSQHYDDYGDMPFHGWGRDSLHDYTNAAVPAMAFQSPMFAIMSKWDTSTAFMMHGPASRSGRDGYMVRDMAWDWLQHVLAYKVAADHPLGFARQAILDRFLVRLTAIHRDIVVPLKTGDRPEGMRYYYEGIARFGQPLTDAGEHWQCHGGALSYYLAGVLVYMKQSGMWGEIQARGGDEWEALLYTVRNAMQYAFGLFAQTRATMFSNPSYPKAAVFADKTDIPKDWAEWSTVGERDGGDLNTNPDGTMRNGDRDASIHLPIQFIYAMRDYFPELDHPLKAAAIAKVDMYLARQTARVKELEGDPGRQRDADHLYRVPGVAPLKAPAMVGPGSPATLPVPAKTIIPVVPPTPFDGLTDADWKLIGKEGNTLTVPADTVVWYGYRNKWVSKVVSGTFGAGNGFFGSDPAPGVTKEVRIIFAKAAGEPVVVPVPDPVPIPAPAPTPEPVPVQVPVPQPDPTPTPDPKPDPVPPAKPTLPLGVAVVAAMIAFLEACGYTVTKK